VIATQDSSSINLPWGAKTNWVRNVLAAGGCTIRWRGADHRVDDPRIIDEAAARPYYSAWSGRSPQVVPGGRVALLHRQGE
jgi:hypothetical protein